jgi:hypothetical protein
VQQHVVRLCKNPDSFTAKGLRNAQLAWMSENGKPCGMILSDITLISWQVDKSGSTGRLQFQFKKLELLANLEFTWNKK